MTVTTAKKAVAYYRTSSATNVGADKDSEERQRVKVAEYATANGFEVVAEYYDAAVKGKDPISTRAGFSELLTYCEENQIRTIMFENAGRLARDQVVQEMGYRELRDSGFALICIEAPEYFTDDSDNPAVALIRQVLGAVAQFQKDEINLKLMGARMRKRARNAERGILTRGGKGKCEGRKCLDETQPALVAAVKRLARKPRGGKKLSLRAVSSRLAGEGFLNSNSKPFSAAQVSRLLGPR